MSTIQQIERRQRWHKEDQAKHDPLAGLTSLERELLAALQVLLRDVEMVRDGNTINDGIELEPALYQARCAIEQARP